MYHELNYLMSVSVEEFYAELDARLRGVKGMNIARLKLFQNTLISILVGYLAIEAGANPTVSVLIIAVINGISIADLATIWGVSVDLRSQDQPDKLPDKADESKSDREIEQR